MAQPATVRPDDIFRFLSSNLPQFIFIAGENGAVEFASRHCSEYTGLCAEELADWRALIHPEDAAALAAHISGTAQTGQDCETECRILRARDGAWRWHVLRARLLEFEPGNRKWLGAAVDVHEAFAKRTRLAGERFRLMMDHSAAGVAVWDKERRITAANESFLRMMGRKRDDFECAPRSRLDDLVGPDFTTLAGLAFEQMAARGSCEVFQCNQERLSTPLLVKGAALDEESGMALVFEIDEQKQLQDRLRQTGKLESLGIIAGGIAHDFNNLLTGILVNASQALQQAAPGSELADSLRGVVQAGERAAALTQQMLAYSGRGRFQLEYVDVSALVSEILILIQSAVGARTRLQLDTPAGLPAVEADPSQLQQIVMNLAINAAEAVAGKGGVFVGTGVVDLDGAIHPDDYPPDRAATAGRYVFLEVRDSGKGMDSNTLQRIFDPFFTTKFAGRGLGLAAVLGIVRSHRGALRVTSAPGAGTSFRVYLPASEQRTTWPSRPAFENRVAGTGMVLVVDDEKYVRETVRRSLEAAGYIAICAANMSEALTLFQSLGSQIELAIVDLTMPDADGDEVVRRLRHLDPKLRVLATSGYPEGEVRARFGDLMDAFLAKPYRSDRLCEVVSSVLAADAAPR